MAQEALQIRRLKTHHKNYRAIINQLELNKKAQKKLIGGIHNLEYNSEAKLTNWKSEFLILLRKSLQVKGIVTG